MKRVVINEKTETGEVHIYPKFENHKLTPTCWCEPHLEIGNENIWVHFPSTIRGGGVPDFVDTKEK